MRGARFFDSPRRVQAVLLATGALAGLVVAGSVVPRVAPRIARMALDSGLARGMREGAAMHGETLPAYALTVLLVLVGALAAAEMRRWPWAKVAWPAGALLVTFAMSPRAAIVALPVVGATAALLARLADEPHENVAPNARRAPLALLGAAALSFAWGGFFTMSGRGLGAAVAGAGACFTAGAVAVAVRARRADDEALARDSLGAAPLLLLPLAALARDPGLPTLAVALLAALAAHAVAARVRSPQRAAELLAAIAAPAALVAILVTPLGWRDLDWVNHYNHEGMHEAWIESALQGKWFMVDAATSYPPLREYALVLWVLARGVTLESVRLGEIVVNLVALPIALATSWRVVRGRGGVQAWYALALAVMTPLRFLLAYDHRISLGWVDVNRTALPLASVVFVMPALVGDGDEPHARRRLLGWGALAGASILYSQEFGLCAVASSLGAVIAHTLFAGPGARARLPGAARRAGTFAAGAAATLAIVALVYAASGRGARFAAGLFRWVAVAGAGVHEAVPLPFSFEVLEHPSALFVRTGEAWPPIAFLLSPAVLVVGALAVLAKARARAFTERDALRLALVLFGFAAYRTTLERSDPWHLTSAAMPALLVAADLAASVRDSVRRARVLVPSLALALALAATAWMGDVDGDLAARLSAIAFGREHPSRGPRYEYADLPHAGDVLVPVDAQELVRLVRREVPPDRPIFCAGGQMESPEWYFLTDRRNPTRFDVLAEIVTKDDQREILASLERDPPALVLGENRTLVGEEVARYLDLHYEPIAGFHGCAVRAPRRPR